MCGAEDAALHFRSKLVDRGWDAALPLCVSSYTSSDKKNNKGSSTELALEEESRCLLKDGNKMC